MSFNRNPRRTPAGTLSKKSASDKSSARSEKASEGLRIPERGTAELEWRGSSAAFGQNPPTQRLRRIENRALAIVEDAVATGRFRTNTTGTKKGYDPYESGRIAKAEARRKKDLRKLGEWLKLCQLAKKNKESAE